MSKVDTAPAEWQTLTEAGRYVGTSKYVVSCLIRAGVLKCEIRKGRKYVSKESLDKFACLGGPNTSWVKDVVRRNRPAKIRRVSAKAYRAHIQKLQALGLYAPSANGHQSGEVE